MSSKIKYVGYRCKNTTNNSSSYCEHCELLMRTLDSDVEISDLISVGLSPPVCRKLTN